MALAYYATKITDNISKTPEGFLICRNVPINRIGYQDYIAEEIGAEGNGMVKVFRSPDEVFSKETLASAEGKDVVDLHPSQWVNVTNFAAYSKGHGQNVRRGAGEDSEYTLADLFIKDAALINKIENGQREVSCGYNCDYEEIEKGVYLQKNIRINHIAIVPNGRAGKEVAIRDSKPTIEKKEKKDMSKGILGKMFKAFAADAEPEEVEAAMKELGKGEEKPAVEPVKDNEHSDVMKQILDGLKGIEARLAKLETAEAAEPDETGLDAFEKELEKGKEESKDAELVPAEKLSGEELPENPIPGADAALTMLRTFKPLVAQISDVKERKKAADSLLLSCKSLLGSSTQKGASYLDLTKGEKAKAEDSKAKAEDSADLGKQLKEKFHRKPINVR